jgi:hypothetical protein
MIRPVTIVQASKRSSLFSAIARPATRQNVVNTTATAPSTNQARAARERVIEAPCTDASE